MQKHLPALVVAALAVTLVSATISMYTVLQHKAMVQRIKALEQRLADHQRAEVERITGKGLESVLEDIRSTLPETPPAVPGAAPEAPPSATHTPDSTDKETP